LDEPVGIAVDSGGNLYIGDSGNARIRKVSGGMITTVAGTETYGFSGDNGPATGVTLYQPLGVAVDSAGNVYFADYLNQRVRILTPSGPSCAYAVTPTSLDSRFSSAVYTVDIQTGPSCAWAISNLPGWISVDGASSGTGSGAATFRVAGASGCGTRMAYPSVAGTTVTVHQECIPPGRGGPSPVPRY
jgi:hypothetical protein